VPILADVSIGRNLGDMHEMGTVDFDAPYDWTQLWDDEKQSGLQVVAQTVPDHNGRRLVPEVIFPVDRGAQVVDKRVAGRRARL